MGRFRGDLGGVHLGDARALRQAGGPLEQDGGRRAVVVNLANWTDGAKVSLEAHDPESTDLVVDLEIDTTTHH